MQKIELKNKEGEELVNKEGKTLVEYRLEIGDEFIPSYNNVGKNTNTATVKGQQKEIDNYYIKAKARDKEGNLIANGEEIYITLTQTQANTLNKHAKDGTDLNQNIFTAYEYQSKKFGAQIGVGIKRETKPAKSFEDFEKEE